ncbi:MAG: hypothetical protein ACJA1W_002959 [Akkermansiaceae bacterium]|jgi:hypothetical protein
MLALRNRIGVASKFSCEIAEFEWIEGLFRLLTQGSSLFSVRDYDEARVVIDEFEVFGAAFEGEVKKGRRGSPICLAESRSGPSANISAAKFAAK